MDRPHTDPGGLELLLPGTEPRSCVPWPLTLVADLFRRILLHTERLYVYMKNVMCAELCSLWTTLTYI
jgi:hypothetical protein